MKLHRLVALVYLEHVDLKALFCPSIWMIFIGTIKKEKFKVSKAIRNFSMLNFTCIVSNIKDLKVTSLYP